MLGISILVFLLTRSDLKSLTITWTTTTSIGFGCAVLALACAQLFSAIRWKYVLGDDARIPFLLRVYLVGLFFSLFLPTSVGGDAIRAVAVSRSSKRPGWAMSSIVLERMLGLIAMFGLLACGALLAPSVFRVATGSASLDLSRPAGRTMAAAAVVLGSAMIFLPVAVRHPAVKRVFSDALGLWLDFARRPASVGAAVVASVFVQTTYLCVWYILALALRLPIPFTHLLVFVPFVSIAAMLPITVAGIGLREGAWVMLLGKYGIGSADAVAFSLIYFGAVLIVSLVGGILFALGRVTPPQQSAVNPFAARPTSVATPGIAG